MTSTVCCQALRQAGPAVAFFCLQVQFAIVLVLVCANRALSDPLTRPVLLCFNQRLKSRLLLLLPCRGTTIKTRKCLRFCCSRESNSLSALLQVLHGDAGMWECLQKSASRVSTIELKFRTENADNKSVASPLRRVNWLRGRLTPCSPRRVYLSLPSSSPHPHRRHSGALFAGTERIGEDFKMNKHMMKKRAERVLGAVIIWCEEGGGRRV